MELHVINVPKPSGRAGINLYKILTDVFRILVIASAGSVIASLHAFAWAGPVRHFTWIYHGQPSPGQRTWTLDRSNRWHEVYPDGHEAKVFDVVARGRVKGCPGSLASSSGEAFFDVFVPDIGCPSMWALFRRDNKQWNLMGQMEDVY